MNKKIPGFVEKKQTEFVDTVLLREWCDKHGVPQGIACFHIQKGSAPGYSAGICNERAKRAGFNGKISEKSLKPSKRQTDVRRRG